MYFDKTYTLRISKKGIVEELKTKQLELGLEAGNGAFVEVIK